MGPQWTGWGCAARAWLAFGSDHPVTERLETPHVHNAGTGEPCRALSDGDASRSTSGRPRTRLAVVVTGR